MVASLAWLGVVLGAPIVEPERLLQEQLLSHGALDQLAGSSDHGERAWSEALDRQEELQAWQLPWIEAVLQPWQYLEAPWPTWSARGWARTVVGNASPVGLLGDSEPGLISQRLGAGLQVQNRWLELRFTPEFGVDALGTYAVDLVNFEAWAAAHWQGWSAGFGARERTLGPGHHSALVIGDGAHPWPAGEVSWERRIRVVGRLRAETSVGWLPGERRDVIRPGLLHMDFRWAPIPMLEIGASRLSLFGGTKLDGTKRPLPSLAQLLVPTDPHVEDDPEGILPDQDELAALDARVTLPLDRWIPGPVDGLEVWYQYGGEDMIMRSIGPIPTPSLAGVANLYGVQLSGSRWWVLAERAVLMDDLFRWYVGHRVYHEGFTRDGQSIGHVNGGDQATWFASAGWTPMPWGGAVWLEQVRRVGAIEKTASGSVLTLMTEEHRWRVGGRVWKVRDAGSHVALGADLAHTTGRDFVPGADDWTARVWVEWRTQTRWGLTGPPWRDPSSDGGAR